MTKLYKRAELIDGVAHYEEENGNVKEIVLDSGIKDLVSSNKMQLDTGLFFQRELTHVMERAFNKKFPELKFRMLFPVSNEINPYMDSYAYKTYTRNGMAKLIRDYGNDLSRVDLQAAETVVKIRTIGASYAYTYLEVEQAQMVGMSLDAKKAEAALRAVEEKLNRMAFFGDDDADLTGLFNNPNVTSGTLSTGAGGGTAFAGKTPEEILADLNEQANAIVQSTKMVEIPTTIMLPPSQFADITSRAKNSASDTTVGQHFMNSWQWGNGIELVPVNECSAAVNPELTNDAMVIYKKDPDTLQMHIPQEYIQHPMQAENLQYTINTTVITGGLEIYYPASVSIVEGI